MNAGAGDGRAWCCGRAAPTVAVLCVISSRRARFEAAFPAATGLGEPIVAERQDNTKRIKLKTLNENTNIPRLAQEMVEKCKLIHPSKLPLVERL